MTERRPHWDQSLIDTVRTAMRPRILTIPDSVDVYDVIAAVEDWQAERQGRSLDVNALLSARMAEAAIQRVRELHRQSHFSNECIECAPGGTYYWPCPTVEALADGAS